MMSEDQLRIRTNDRIERCQACGEHIIPTETIYILHDRVACSLACAEQIADRVETN